LVSTASAGSPMMSAPVVPAICGMASAGVAPKNLGVS
jgi:hypothetical protein